jgi:hypothetical protein
MLKGFETHISPGQRKASHCHGANYAMRFCGRNGISPPARGSASGIFVRHHRERDRSFRSECSVAGSTESGGPKQMPRRRPNRVPLGHPRTSERDGVALRWSCGFRKEMGVTLLFPPGASISSSMVSELGRSSDARAVDAAEDLAFLLHAVSNYATTTMGTSRREPLDRAFEAVKNMALSVDRDFESSVVVISADLTFSHHWILKYFPVTNSGDWQCLIVRFSGAM